MLTKNFNPTDLVATPQLSQVEVRFKAPLEKNSIVERVSDLVNITIINPKFSYPHKHIWVMETESFWYIEDRVISIFRIKYAHARGYVSFHILHLFFPVFDVPAPNLFLK